MNETPDEPRRPDDDRRRLQNDPTVTHPMGRQPQPPHQDDDNKPAIWRRIRSRRRIVAAAIAVMVLLVGGTGFALAGGGDDGEEPTPEEDELTPEEAAFEFTQCMRDNGIDGYPDPTVDADGGIVFEGLSDLGVTDEQMQAAQEACEPILDESPPAGAGEPQAVDPAAAGWERIVPGGDCQCADGSEYSFYARQANPNKVVLFLDGGGACWSAETCAPDSDNEYQTTVDAPNGEGVFDFADERNPFADYSFVFVPYCTGDVHLGDATTEYAPDLTVQHKGYVNGTAALDYLTATFPDATDVVVIGVSAGSVAAPLYAGLVSDRLPDANITAVADSSGAYPDLPELNARLTAAWDTADAIPPWPENAGLTAEQWSVARLFIQSGRHDPDITFARYDHAYDERQASDPVLAGVSVDDLLALVDANEAQIEDAGVNLHSFTAPGDDHVVFDNESFYSETVNGVALVDWVTKLLEGEPVDDVHCTDCMAG